MWIFSVTKHLLIYSTCLLLMLLTACGQRDDALPTLNTLLSCEQIISTALTSAVEQCGTTGYSRACYGYRQVEAVFQRRAGETFQLPGDNINLVDVQAVRTSPLDPVQQSFGMTVLSGQGVRYVLFGGAALTQIVPLMNAARLQSIISDTNCQGSPGSGLLAQAVTGVQANLGLNGATLTIGSTVYITALSGHTMNIATLEGVTIVSAFDTSRITRAGFQVVLPLGGEDGLEVVGPPSDLQPYDLGSARPLPLVLLERPVTLPAATPGADAPPSTPAPTPIIAEDCEPDSTWTASYTVQRGDNLTIIAQFYDTTVAELQAANCLSNPNRIRVGDVLRVPDVPPTAAP